MQPCPLGAASRRRGLVSPGAADDAWGCIGPAADAQEIFGMGAGTDLADRCLAERASASTAPEVCRHPFEGLGQELWC